MTATQNEVALSYTYHRVRGLYFLVVIFVAAIIDVCTALQLELWSKLILLAYRFFVSITLLLTKTTAAQN